MAGMPMVVADLAVLCEVLRADGTAPVAFVAPLDTEAWISAIGKALAAPPAARAAADFARAVGRKYSRQRMIESYLSLFDVYARPPRDEFAELPAAAEEVRP
jgi:glycosyltransferase involved in cell wall biosynthesis